MSTQYQFKCAALPDRWYDLPSGSQANSTIGTFGPLVYYELETQSWKVIQPGQWRIKPRGIPGWNPRMDTGVWYCELNDLRSWLCWTLGRGFVEVFSDGSFVVNKTEAEALMWGLLESKRITKVKKVGDTA